jgi:arabinofuranosyltransferase
MIRRLHTIAARLPWFAFAAVALVVAGVAATLWYASERADVTAKGFPLDDAWIHLQFARNLAEGHGYSFNPGIPSSGSTAPLWTLLLAVPLALGAGPVDAGIALGQVFFWLTALAAYVLTLRVTGSRWTALLATAASVLTPRLVWAGLSGMEVSLYAFLVTASLACYVSALAGGGRWTVAWGALIGLAGCARPETFLVVPLLFLHWFWTRYVKTDRRAGNLVAPALCLAVIALFVAFNYVKGGRPLPNTFYAKTYGMGTALSLAEGRPLDALEDALKYPLRFLEHVVHWQTMQLVGLFGGALAGVLALLGLLGRAAPPGGRLIVAILVAMPVLKALGAPEPPILVHDGRYVAHLLVLAIVLCAVGFLALHRLITPRWLVPLLAVGALGQLGAASARGAEQYAREVRNINDLQLVTARWLHEVTTAEARIATNDIGAIAYYGTRFIIDTEGLVTPEAIKPKRARKLLPFLEAQRPDLLVIFPEWYPELSARTDVLHEIRRFSAERVIAGGRSLVVYRMPWTRPAVLRMADEGPRR